VIRTLRVTREHLDRFAASSGDRNPLHVDAAYARATPYGRNIAQGALVTIAALGIADELALNHLKAIHVQFKQPVFPDEDYVVSLLASSPDSAEIEVSGRGRAAVAITLAFDPQAPLPEVEEQTPATLRTSPARPTVEELAAPDSSLREPYSCDLDALAPLADELGAGGVPRTTLVWLAAASYTIGMVVPGEDALFVGARITRSTSPDSGRLSGSVTFADDRTGLVGLDVVLEQHDASARMTLQAFLRAPVAPPDRPSIERFLASSTRLSGRNLLVVGASRGLGAALTGAFALQGATVWAGFAESSSHMEAIRSEFGTEAIRPLRFDAEDIEATRAALATVADGAGSLDGVVLCAAPPMHEASLHPDASESTLQFVRSSVAMALVPLAESLRLLAPEGWVVVLSSSGLDDPPDVWPHYTIAKAALEGAASYCRRHTGARVLVARAPKMATDSMNTPLGRLNAVPMEQVAAAIVRWTISGDDSRPDVLSGDELSAVATAEPGA
jgi:NAD(P)-dependent dehydrogenase (short-subunit alcohol dehydrogenase family)/acyl dehydratase